MTPPALKSKTPNMTWRTQCDLAFIHFSSCEPHHSPSSMQPSHNTGLFYFLESISLYPLGLSQAESLNFSSLGRLIQAMVSLL